VGEGEGCKGEGAEDVEICLDYNVIYVQVTRYLKKQQLRMRNIFTQGTKSGGHSFRGRKSGDILSRTFSKGHSRRISLS
jgi:hypothetical protein